MINRILKSIILCSLFLNSAHSFSADKKAISLRSLGLVYFRVLAVSGGVYFSKPLSGEFRLAKIGQIIPDGSLLRVEEGGAITIEAEDNLRRVGMSIKRSRVSIRIPIILRLGRESFRRIVMDTKMLSQFDSKIRRSASESENAFRKMSEAWKQMAAILSPDTSVDESILKQIVDALNKGKKKEEDVGISIQHGKIDFISPNDRQILLTDKVPTGLKIMWQREKAPEIDLMQYELFFWRQGEPKEKQGISIGNKFSVSVQKPGKYYMQVQSTDGVYRSKLRAVQIELSKDILKDKAKFSDKGRDDAIRATLSRRIKALAPDRNLVWVGDGNWPIFEFEWSRPEICSLKVVYEIIVKDNTKNQIYKRTINKEAHQWRPPKDFFGPLFWEARVIGCMDGNKKVIELDVNTIPRRLELVRLDKNNNLFKRIGQPRFNGTIFFNAL
jgi:hypothetical protein